jgi:hypothetical protein
MKITCPNCGHHEADAGGDCLKCREPVGASKTAKLTAAKASRNGEAATSKKSGTKKGQRQPSQATSLVKQTGDCELWHTPDGVGYISLPVDRHVEHWPLRSNSFKRWLQREYFLKAKAACNAQAVQDAIGVLEGKAMFDSPQYDVYLRMAEDGGKVFLDLCDDQWRIVEVGPRGWRVVNGRKPRFRRTKSMLSLPEPQQRGDVAELRYHLGLCEDGYPLVVGWMVAALRESGPFPVLNLYAEQGAGKTTAARKIRSLIDPNTAPMRSESKEPRDLMIAAHNGWAIALDNVSHITPWMSDCLCRLSTGGGFSTRELYSDQEEVIFDAMRPVIITGIEDVVTRGDLLDRSIIVTLPNIPEDKRRPEGEIWREFDEAKPRLLGVLLDAVSSALRNLPTTSITKLPRMADFALWATAAETALGLKSGEFMDVYGGNRAVGNELAIEASPVGKVVLDLMNTTSVWTGTASELLTELDATADDKTTKSKYWPKGGRSLSGCLKRLAPNLRAVGIEVEFGSTGRGRDKRRSITLGRVRGNSVPSVPSVPTTENQEARGDGGVVGVVDGDAAGTQGSSAVDSCTATAGTQGDDGDGGIPLHSADALDAMNAELVALSPEEDAMVEEFMR